MELTNSASRTLRSAAPFILNLALNMKEKNEIQFEPASSLKNDLVRLRLCRVLVHRIRDDFFSFFFHHPPSPILTFMIPF